MLIGFGGNRGRVGWPAVTQPWPVVRVRGGRVIRRGRIGGAWVAEFFRLTREPIYDNDFSYLSGLANLNTESQSSLAETPALFKITSPLVTVGRGNSLWWERPIRRRERRGFCMPTNPVQFKESLMRRIVRAAHKENMQISYIEVLPDRTVRVHTVPRPPLDLDLNHEIESLIDETCLHGEVAT